MPLDSHELPDGQVVKMGRIRPSVYDDPRTHNVFRLARYVDRAVLGDPPEFVDNTDCLQPIMGHNDRMGDCLLPGTSVVAPGLQSVYRIPYSGPVVMLVTASGKRLTVTCNHLVLTTRGFVRAGELQEGDDVLSSDLPQAVAVRVDDNGQHVPTPVEEIFQAQMRVGAAIGAPVLEVERPVHFHGDAAFFKGKVNVVDADRLLDGRHVAPLGHPEGEFRFPPTAAAAHALNGQRALLPHLGTIALATSRGLGGSSSSASLLGRHVRFSRFGRIAQHPASFGRQSRGAQAVGIRATPLLDASDLEPLPHCSGVGMQFTRDLYQAFPGLVAPDRIIELSAAFYDGHVYDTSTLRQWYIANGIVSHNCTIVGEANFSILASTMVGQTVQITDDDCEARYSKLTGYDPQTGDNDNGAIETEILNDWRHDPFAGISLLGYASIDVHDLDLIRHAIDLFAAVYVGLSLPNTARPQTGPHSAWDVVAGTVPGDWGGHCVIIPKFDWRARVKRFHAATWAFYQPMTEAFWRACGDEVYAPLPSVWLEHPRNGVNVDLLKQDLAALGHVA